MDGNSDNLLVYKYRECNDKTFDSLENNYVWMSNSQVLNDKFEFHSYMDLDYIIKELLNNKYEEIKKGIILEGRKILESTYGSDGTVDVSKMSSHQCIAAFLADFNLKFLYKYSDNTVIGCFSYSYNIEPMWSFYSNYNKGIVIGYSKDELIRSNDYSLSVLYNDNSHNMTNLFIEGMKNYVDYKQNYSDSMTPEEYKEQYNLKWDETTLYKFIQDKLATKHTDWSYEKEFRSIKLTTRKVPGHKLMIKPKEVILGSHIDEADRERIIEICNKQGIEIKQMRYMNNKFRKFKIQ